MTRLEKILISCTIALVIAIGVCAVLILGKLGDINTDIGALQSAVESKH